jgi:LacI family transcriptional regulator
MDLKQLSARLGLSPTTVSRALNGYPEVSERTRQRVIAEAAEVGYKPNAMARGLARGPVDAIGIVYPTGAGHLDDPRFLEVVNGLTERFSQDGIDFLIASARQQDELAMYQRLLRGRRVDGFIVHHTRRVDPRLAYLAASDAPFVAYGRTDMPDSYAWFDFDNAAGSALAVQRLRGFGHSRIAYVHAPLQLHFAYQRHQGYLDAMQEAGLPVDSALVIPAGFGRRGGYEAMKHLLGRAERPTAVIVDNNLCGVGVLRSALDAGLEIGRQISVIVYDGTPLDALVMAERVTAIEQPTSHRVGVQLAELMLGVLAGKPAHELQTLWAPGIAPGTSDGPVWRS